MGDLHSLRPAPGTATRRVWDIADEIAQRSNGRPKRSEVIKAYEAEGGNANTASTQYQYWKSEHEAVRRSASMPPATQRFALQVKEAGRILLPIEIRAALDIREGDTLAAELVDGELRLMPLQTAVRRAQELVRQFVPEGTSLVDLLLDERRAEAAREKKR